MSIFTYTLIAFIALVVIPNAVGYALARLEVANRKHFETRPNAACKTSYNQLRKNK